MAEKSLIIISPGFPSDEGDSTCLPTQQLFTRTVIKLFPEIQITVIALQYPARESRYAWHGATVHALNGKKYRGISRVVFWIKTYRLLLKISTGKNVKGVISFWCNETALIGNYFAKKRSIPHKIWITGQDARKNNRFVNWIKPPPDDLVAMSDFLRAEFFKNHAILPAHIVSNAVQPSFLDLPKDIDIVGAGSLIPLKQYEIFVEVIKEVKKMKPTLTVALFGKGPQHQELTAMIENLGLTDTIKMYGEVDHSTLLHWMNRSKVLLHPSSYEGYSTVCLEALASGCHVVSFTYAEASAVPHWKIVSDKTEMISTVCQILEHDSDFTPILTRDIETTTKEFISLFTAQ